MKQWLKEALHNCVAHPLMMFLPNSVAIPLHDKTAKWAYPVAKEEVSKSEIKVLLDRFEEGLQKWEPVISKKTEGSPDK